MNAIGHEKAPGSKWLGTSMVGSDVSLGASPANRDFDVPPIQAPDGAGAVCGIVLAGSYHWGATAFEKTFRGPMLPLAQTPLICYPLNWLRTGGVRQAVVCANSATESVRGYLGDGSRMSMDLKYFEDHVPRGPAGCARDATTLSDAGVFVIVEGALVPGLDLRALLDSHRRSGAMVTVVAEVERRKHTQGTQQPRMSGGIYVFDRSALADVPDRGYQDIKEGLLSQLYSRGVRALTFEMQGVTPRVLDYGTYARASRWLISRSLEFSPFLSHYKRIGDRLQHPAAIVSDTARFVGPVIVGAKARVDDGAVVVGPATIGASSHIEANALVSRSLIWEQVVVARGAAVDCCLLADHTVIEAGKRLYGAVEIRDARGRRVPTAAMQFADFGKITRSPLNAGTQHTSGYGAREESASAHP